MMKFNRSNVPGRTMRALCISVLLLSLSVRMSAQNTSRIDTVSAGPHALVRFSVKMQNADPCVAYQADIVLPSVLAYEPESAQLAVTRSNGHTLSATLTASNTLRILIYSVAGNAFNGSDGAIFTFDCLTASAPGTYGVALNSVIMSSHALVNISTGASAGVFTLLAPKLELNADTLGFGSRPLLSTTDLTLTLRNTGNLPLSLTRLVSTLSEIAIPDAAPCTIDPGGSINRTVRFQPVVKGMKTAVINVSTNDPADTLHTLPVKAQAYAVNELRIGSASARSGHEAVIRLRVNNMEPFSALQCTIALPSVMKYKMGSAMFVGRNTDHALALDTTGSTLHVLCYSPTNSPFTESDGDILELRFAVDGQGGSYTLRPDGALLTDASGMNLLSASYAGSLTIAAPLIQLSTSTADLGSVSVFDTARTSVTLDNNGDDTLFIFSALCPNPDFLAEGVFPIVILPWASKNLTVRFHNGVRGSYTTQMTLYHNDAPRNPSTFTLKAAAFIPNSLRVRSCTGRAADTVTLALELDNAEPVTGLQADLVLPPQMTYIAESAVPASRGAGQTVSASVLAGGKVRIISFSMGMNPFTGTSGAVITLKCVLGATLGDFPVSLENVVISNAAFQNVATGSASGIVTILAGLPVELVSFTAKAEGPMILLRWNTATENNAMGFEIERARLAPDQTQRSPSRSWCRIGYVEGHGTTNAPQAYAYIDRAAAGSYVYRLKQIDRDGGSTYSHEAMASIEAPKAFALMQNYPNPFNPATRIPYEIAEAVRVRLSVYDMLGREVAVLVNEEMQPGVYTAELNGSQLPSGLYFYRLEAGQFSVVRKLTIMK